METFFLTVFLLENLKQLSAAHCRRLFRQAVTEVQ